MKNIVSSILLLVGLVVVSSTGYSTGLTGGSFCNYDRECPGTEVCSSLRCCEPLGEDCSSDADCCSGNCYGTTCSSVVMVSRKAIYSSPACTVNYGSCRDDSNCCSHNCESRQCIPLTVNSLMNGRLNGGRMNLRPYVQSCTADSCGYGKACIDGQCCSGFNVPCRSSSECCNGMTCMNNGPYSSTTVCV